MGTFFSPGTTIHCGFVFCSPLVITSSLTRFLDHIRHTTVGRTPLDEWSVRRRDLYLTTHNTRNRQTSMPPVGFEPTISAGERPYTYVLQRAATGTGIMFIYLHIYIYMQSKTQQFVRWYHYVICNTKQNYKLI